MLAETLQATSLQGHRSQPEVDCTVHFPAGSSVGCLNSQAVQYDRNVSSKVFRIHVVGEISFIVRLPHALFNVSQPGFAPVDHGLLYRFRAGAASQASLQGKATARVVGIGQELNGRAQERLDDSTQEKGRLDVVFANAGVGSLAPLGAITEELYDQTSTPM
jgi:hypothetical protein